MKLKQQDVIVLVVALFAAVVVSIIAGKYFFSNSASQNTQVDLVPAVHSDFTPPSNQYFNSSAIDPTQIINISPNSSQQPFNQ